MRPIALCLAALVALAAAPAPGADEVSAAARLLERAEASLAAARTSAERRAALARAGRAHEAALAALRAELREVGARRAALEAGAEAREEKLGALLAALERIARIPATAALAHPDGPAARARAGMIVADMTPALIAEARRLSDEIAAMDAARIRRDAALNEARAALAALRGARAEIDALLEAERRGGDPAARAVRDRLAAEAEAAGRTARTVAALAGGLGPAPEGAEAAAPVSFAAAKGRLPAPVLGAITRKFGDDDPRIGALTGIEIEAAAYAQVTSPWRATVRYVGAFRDFGNMVILEPDSGWLIVLAGLGGTDREVGETVLAGEPLGSLGGAPPAAEEFLIEFANGSAGLGRETLYMEIRRDGAPVDPEPWIDFDG